MLTLNQAGPLATFFTEQLSPVCESGFCNAAGGYRRGKSQIHDLEFVVLPLDKTPTPRFGVKAIDTPRNLLESRLLELSEVGFLIFSKGDKKNRKYWINLGKFGIVPEAGEPADFLLDLWITLPPAQYGVNLAIRTGPNSRTNKFSKWIVTNRKNGGALPDDYRVRDCAVWHISQINEQTDKPKAGESPLPMPHEEDFLNFVGVTDTPGERRAAWNKYR